MEKDKVQIAMDYWIDGNLIEAEKLLLEEAESGNGHAAHNLAALYQGGGPGVQADNKKANYWYEVALATGFEETVATDPTWFRKK